VADPFVSVPVADAFVSATVAGAFVAATADDPFVVEAAPLGLSLPHALARARAATTAVAAISRPRLANTFFIIFPSHCRNLSTTVNL
jgi:hypothetical protein